MISTPIVENKSLIYQVMLLMNSGVIILTITLTIILIEDQKKELKQRSVSALVPITATVKTDPNI